MSRRTVPHIFLIFFLSLLFLLLFNLSHANSPKEVTEKESEHTEETSSNSETSKNSDELAVKITSEIPFLEVLHDGKIVKIQRIQDASFKITNSFARTSRKCPPFCIRPIDLSNGVLTFGELELLDFLKNKVRNNKGLLIDARLSDWHIKGTIPGSISIPFTMFTGGLEDIHTVELLELLGAKEKDGTFNFDNAMELALFCNGPWCGQSPQAISHLLKVGYPPGKLFWYRGGMQAWQSFGLTTIKP